VDVLDPQPGESVLDMCAAPGGKTTYIAQKMKNRGRIIAADSSNARLGLVAENCKRLRVSIVATLACEGTRLDRCLRGEQFDRVLVDAPCSNTGVMRRRPDLRWRIEEKEIARLAALQSKLLGKAAEFVKPGGVLVYSTCSLEPEENERVVERFLGGNPEFTLEATRSSLPTRDGIDGAFVARFGRH
jgi:16S rRNA (cytosine967-C5)-methyltransferase